MKIKTSKLTGAALDWAVAKCEGRVVLQILGGGLLVNGRTEAGEELDPDLGFNFMWHPSTDWAQGGVILEREKITVGYERYGAQGGETWDAVKKALDDTALWLEYGPTPLIAAMRVFVASRLGNEVDVPEELAALVKGE